MEHSRRSIIMLISFLLILTLSALIFLYLLLPVEATLNPKECSIGKVVDKTKGYFYSNRYQMIYIWEFESSEVREYFVATSDYNQVKKGDIVRFCSRGYFITALVRIRV